MEQELPDEMVIRITNGAVRAAAGIDDPGHKQNVMIAYIWVMLTIYLLARDKYDAMEDAFKVMYG